MHGDVHEGVGGCDGEGGCDGARRISDETGVIRRLLFIFCMKVMHDRVRVRVMSIR